METLFSNLGLEWMKNHPVSNVIWIETEKIKANDYNPNTVAKPEMELLKHSIESDGFTQPIVVWKVEDYYEVVDGFHRHLVGKELGLSHLPVVIINKNRTERNDRIASTIRHNRARGKHKVDSMSDIVIELSRRNWSDKRIAKELGMDQDEVLRLKQITGLAEMFRDEDFSKAWE
jgi:ParB-like chromosome segregation protein Spo0J